MWPSMVALALLVPVYVGSGARTPKYRARA